MSNQEIYAMGDPEWPTIVNEMKEEICFVSQDLNTDKKLAEESD